MIAKHMITDDFNCHGPLLIHARKIAIGGSRSRSRICAQFYNRLSALLHIAEAVQEPGLAVAHEFTAGPQIRCDHRARLGIGLKNCLAQRFVGVRWEHSEPRLPDQPIARLGTDASQELNIREPERGRELLQLALLWAVSRHQQAQSAYVLHGSQQVIHALLSG
jgi:hypothetical protein